MEIRIFGSFMGCDFGNFDNMVALWGDFFGSGSFPGYHFQTVGRNIPQGNTKSLRSIRICLQGTYSFFYKVSSIVINRHNKTAKSG